VFSFRVADKERICYVTAVGRLTLQSCIEIIDTGIKARNSKNKPGYSMLVDLRKVKYDLKAREIGYLSSYVATKKKYSRGKIALVTTGYRNRLIVDMFCSGAARGGVSINSFSDMNNARKWLYKSVNIKSVAGK